MTDTASATDIFEEMYARGWTDGLPVVPPARDRVQAMLGRWRPDRVVAVLEPGRGEATVEKIAANAVMAGCLPAYFPVVLAAVEAVADSGFGLEGVLTTVHSESPVLLINGPVIDDLGFNAGSNTLGNGFRANATIGRALSLVSRNIAGARAGALDSATIGQPGKYSYCFAENEAASPWPPFHVEAGFAADASTVTAYGGDAPLCLAVLSAERPEPIIRTIADALTIGGTYTFAFGGDLMIVMSPEHANICAAAGMSKDDTRQAIYEHAQRPAGSVRGLGVIDFGERTPHWYSEAKDTDPVRPVRAPENLKIVVAGGEMGGYSAVIFGHGRTITKPIIWEEATDA